LPDDANANSALLRRRDEAAVEGADMRGQHPAARECRAGEHLGSDGGGWDIHERRECAREPNECGRRHVRGSHFHDRNRKFRRAFPEEMRRVAGDSACDSDAHTGIDVCGKVEEHRDSGASDPRRAESRDARGLQDARLQEGDWIRRRQQRESHQRGGCAVRGHEAFGADARGIARRKSGRECSCNDLQEARAALRGGQGVDEVGVDHRADGLAGSRPP
jgi:hypothetical protein